MEDFGTESMEQKEEKMLQQAANSRLVHLNEQLIFPLLSRNADQMLVGMIHEMKTTGRADVAKLAYIAACKDLASELERVAQTGDRAVVRLDEYRNK